MAQAKQYWLMKTEPESFSIQDLAKSPRKTTFWDGVRNYQARNFMRAMTVGDEVLFYHSNADPPAVVGTASVVGEAYPDRTAWDPGNHHFDPKASPTNPIWDMVDIRLGEIFPRPLALDELRACAGAGQDGAVASRIAAVGAAGDEGRVRDHLALGPVERAGESCGRQEACQSR